MRFALFLCAVLIPVAGAFAQAIPDSTEDDEYSSDEDSLVIASPFDTHASCGIAFGIGALSAQDMVALINQELGANTVTSNGLGGAAGFSGSFAYRLLDFYDAAISYAFLTKAYAFGDDIDGVTNYSFDLHEFSLYVHRVFLDDYFSLSFGAGAGLVLGVFRKSYSLSDFEERGTVKGWSAGAEMVFRSAISGNVFLHTELRANATFTPAVLDAHGNPFHIQTADPPHDLRLNTFGGSVSVGVDYCF